MHLPTWCNFERTLKQNDVVKVPTSAPSGTTVNDTPGCTLKLEVPPGNIKHDNARDDSDCRIPDQREGLS